MTLVLSLAGCGKTAPAESSAAESVEPQVTEEAESPAEESVEEPVEEENQNPVMNFIGVYSTADSMEALVEAEETENAKITVTYAGNPWFHHQTVMSGRFDPETLTVEFTDAAKKTEQHTNGTLRRNGS